MDGANARFMARKAAWLADHLILYAVTQVGSAGDNPWGQALGTVNTLLPIKQFDLRKLGSIINNGVPAKAYELYAMNQGVNSAGQTTPRVVTGSTNTIDAYFLPWGAGRTFSGLLGAAADYFFTPTLNGCTFAHNGAGPAPSVAHANYVDPNTITDQNAIDNALNQAFNGGHMQTLIKANYKLAVLPQGGMDYRAMVVGLRVGGNWSFYYQHYYVGLANNQIVSTGLNLCIPI